MTYETKPHILIVDDEESICKTLSLILQTEGYQITTATTAKEALEKTKIYTFDLALLDIRLPDMDGIQLLGLLQKEAPGTIKIIITGYPSLQNAIEALNIGADSYFMKPIDPSELLKTVKTKLEAKQQAEITTKEKLAKWVQSQARKQSTSLEKFLEETATELADFGLTKTQAKIYITLVALGVASASEIAALSKIRREEVYRIIPILENQGIIIRRLGTPTKFSAVQPEKAIQHLFETRLKTLKEKIDKLNQNQTKLISKLKTIELPSHRGDCSIEVIPHQGRSQKENLFMRTINIAQNAKQQIDVIAPLETLKYAYLNCPKNLKEKLKTIRIRVITESHEPDSFTKIIQSKASDTIELKQLEKLPFSLVIIDDKEAIWGEFKSKNENAYTLWTNDQTQICILKTSFESLWQKASCIQV